MKKNKKNRNKNDEQEKPKGEFYTEDSLIDKSLMYRSDFLCFLPQDAIYYANRANLLNDDLKLVLRRMVGELNYMLYLTFQEFWATVLYNSTFRKCLQSCLTYFNRRKYNQYLRQQHPFAQIKDNEVAELQGHLFKLVLTLYYRILYSDQENPDLWKKFKLGEEIYNQWIFDMPKLFDFMDIYATDNHEIVQVMVNRVFEINADYRLDFKDVLGELSKTILPRLFERLKFINDREEFDEGLNEMEIIKKVEVLMMIKDVLSALQQSFHFFAPEISSIILADFKLLQYCENIYYEIYNGYKNWKLGDCGVPLKPLMDSIAEDTVDLWESIFIRFKQVLLNTGDVDLSRLPDKQITGVFKQVVMGFGTVLSLGTKNKDKKRNLMLLQRITDRVDLEELIIDLNQDGLEKREIEPGQLQEFLKAVAGIKQIKEKRANAERAENEGQLEEAPENPPEDDDAPEEQPEEDREEIEPDAEGEEVQEEKPKPQGITLPPPVLAAKQSSIGKKKPVLTREQQQQNRRKLDREYDDDYDDVADYNRRMNDKHESDDTESDGGDLIEPNPNHNRDTSGQQSGNRNFNRRGGRGGQQYAKRGEQRTFDNPKVIEQRNRSPRQPREQKDSRPTGEKKKYTEVTRANDERRDTAPRANDGAKKKYREKQK